MVRSLTSSTTAPILFSVFGNSSVNSLPTISLITFCRSVLPTGFSLTVAPSRITVMKSEIANTSSNLWLTKITALLAALSDFITVINRSTSEAERAAVGSSIKIIFAFMDNAFAISTTC